MSVRMVCPGEVDHEIARDDLDYVPIPVLTPRERVQCERIFDLYVAPQANLLIPHVEFCDLEKSLFLDYAASERGLLLVGHGDSGVSDLPPTVLALNLVGWNRPRHFAFRRSVEAILIAISHGNPSPRSTIAWPFAQPEQVSECFYFGFDYRNLRSTPWRCGTMYLYRQADFPDDVWAEPFLSDVPIRPIARLSVEPQDWPLLDRVEGFDPKALDERMRDSFEGFPWRADPKVHPLRGNRAAVEEMRSYIDQHPDEPASLARLGNLVGMSPFGALRSFQAAMGQSPREYSTRARIGRARGLLKAGVALAEAAVECGFYDQSHFSAHFKRITGLTPGAYVSLQESPRH